VPTHQIRHIDLAVPFHQGANHDSVVHRHEARAGSVSISGRLRWAVKPRGLDVFVAKSSALHHKFSALFAAYFISLSSLSSSCCNAIKDGCQGYP
jgi:hypothetical protein